MRTILATALLILSGCPGKEEPDTGLFMGEIIATCDDLDHDSDYTIHAEPSYDFRDTTFLPDEVVFYAECWANHNDGEGWGPCFTIDLPGEGIWVRDYCSPDFETDIRVVYWE